VYDDDAGERDADTWLFFVTSTRHGPQIIFIELPLLSFFAHAQ
jgi:hypothetical protein